MKGFLISRYRVWAHLLLPKQASGKERLKKRRKAGGHDGASYLSIGGSVAN